MGQIQEVVSLDRKSAGFPAQLAERLGDVTLTALGPLSILSLFKTAFFCSARTPGDAILRSHDIARRLRDEGATVISGFHSPIEKECLQLLLRGKQPIIICPARAIEGMRIPTGCRAAYDAGRVLFLSPFTKAPKRVTTDSAWCRNKVVAALADDAYIAHVTPGGQTSQVVDMLRKWQVPLVSH